jgi:hypothetical protein
MLLIMLKVGGTHHMREINFFVRFDIKNERIVRQKWNIQIAKCYAL